jgi:hypothetical protein
MACGGFFIRPVAPCEAAPVHPPFWRIRGGRLYLNFDAPVQRRWERDIHRLLVAAGRNGPGVLTG